MAAQQDTGHRGPGTTEHCLRFHSAWCREGDSSDSAINRGAKQWRSDGNTPTTHNKPVSAICLCLCLCLSLCLVEVSVSCLLSCVFCVRCSAFSYSFALLLPYSLALLLSPSLSQSVAVSLTLPLSPSHSFFRNCVLSFSLSYSLTLALYPRNIKS